MTEHEIGKAKPGWLPSRSLPRHLRGSTKQARSLNVAKALFREHNFVEDAFLEVVANQAALRLSHVGKGRVCNRVAIFVSCHIHIQIWTMRIIMTRHIAQ